MTDQLLNILKLALLGLLYLFFARVLWTVWTEVRSPRTVAPPAAPPAPAPSAPAPTAGPATRSRRAPRKGRSGGVGRLVVVEPKARRGHAYGVDNEMTIGRADGCTLTVHDDTFISQVHARFFTADNKVWVEDLTSTNGTYLNGKRLTRAEALRRGDRVQVGSTVLEAQ
jgi:pSer/pThr/pTyr-binding forkhead associated (FHA) protein